MDTQALFNIAITCAGGLALWVLNAMTRQIQRLEDKLENLPHDYVAKDDYRSDIKEVKDILRQIFDKLDGKADKA
jgi:cell fate (sporulation/competence/biofilm development) regulator YmcA (YheA/YmcA/DUF963 family)